MSDRPAPGELFDTDEGQLQENSEYFDAPDLPGDAPQYLPDSPDLADGADQAGDAEYFNPPDLPGDAEQYLPESPGFHLAGGPGPDVMDDSGDDS